MRNLLNQIELKSKYLMPIYCAFEIEIDTDIIYVEISSKPQKGKNWHITINSNNPSKYEDDSINIENSDLSEEATPEQIASNICKKLKIIIPYKIKNIKKNFIELNIPKLMEQSLISLNYPEQESKIERLSGCVLFADLKNFSNWSLNAEPEQLSEVFAVISERVVQMSIDYYFDYWKLLGDGILLVWHGEDSIDNSIDAAYALHKKYWYYREEAKFKVPLGFRIAICSGFFTKYTSATFFENIIIKDYIGPIINMAARLQSFANPGEVLVNKNAKMNSKSDWFTYQKVSNEIQTEVLRTKGFSPNEDEIYRVNHKYFNNDWENFIITK